MNDNIANLLRADMVRMNAQAQRQSEALEKIAMLLEKIVDQQLAKG